MNFTLIKKISYYFFVGLILLCGFLIRLKLLLDNPSFWFDESCLGFNLLELNFKEFFGILHLQQIAPPLFMVVSKIFVSIFGASDLKLRLFPFVVGNLAMIMFFLLLKQNFQNKLTILTGLILFCFNAQMIKFSVEFKPYILETFCTCLILYVFPKINWNWSYKKLALLGMGFAIMPWFAFVSAGMFFIAFALKFTKKFLKKYLILVLPFLISSVLLAIYYLKIKTFYSGFMLDFFKKSFFTIKDFPIQFIICFNYLFTIKLAIVPLLLFIGGIVYALAKRKYTFCISFSILIFVGYTICSFAQIYPFYDRFVLFLFPIILMSIMILLNSLFKVKSFFTTTFALLLILILFNPMRFFVQKSLSESFNKKSYSRQMFEMLVEKQQKEDSIIVDTLSAPDFLYYNKYYYLTNRLYINIEEKNGIILYLVDKDKMPTIDKKYNSWIYSSWPSVNAPSLDYYCTEQDKKNGMDCSFHIGKLLYIKGKN